ncbi:MAG: sugar phosphate isomerase/epimerase [Sphingomonadales bacterium]|nr:sugar phosphate isomerase/epimerase [Sphingomonadales bacterium]
MITQDTPGIVGRRSMLKIAAAGAGLAMAPGLLAATSTKRFFGGKDRRLGIELYMLGDGVGKDLEGTLMRLAGMGYREIELPNLLGHTPREIRVAADKAGLSISSIHLPLVRQAMPNGLSLGTEPARLAEALGELGARWAVAPLVLLPRDFRVQPGETFPKAIGRSVRAASPDIWKETAALLNDRAAALRTSGVRVGYHNHNLEFAPIGNTTGFDILLAETDPKLVHFEVDIGWVAAAGLDPVRFFDRLHGRVALLHVKDLTAASPVNFEIGMEPADVGTGRMPLRRVLDAAWNAGARHFLVEQEPPFQGTREAAAKVAINALERV